MIGRPEARNVATEQNTRSGSISPIAIVARAMSVRRLMTPPTGATIARLTSVSGIGLAISDIGDRPFNVSFTAILNSKSVLMNLSLRVISARNYRACRRAFHDPMRVLTLNSTIDAAAFVSKCFSKQWTMFEQALDIVLSSRRHDACLRRADLRSVVDIKINKPVVASEAG